MTRREQERRLYNQLMRGDNFESNADAPLAAPLSPAAAETTLKSAKGNPGFAAQFDINVLLKYFTVAGGAFTSRTAAYVLANAAALATQLAFFLFGNSDWAAGYARVRQQFPLQGGWAYGTPFVYGADYPYTSAGVLDATASAVLVPGDLVIPVSATVAGPVTYVALIIMRCTQVAYATLLDALSSDRFTMNMVRYIIDTVTYGLNQYANNIFVMKQSLFGKFDSDFISPNSFKLPEQFQAGIIDVPIQKGIDKQVALGSYINYDTVALQWSLFVKTVHKLDY